MENIMEFLMENIMEIIMEIIMEFFILQCIVKKVFLINFLLFKIQ